jgi:hypothetical protein
MSGFIRLVLYTYSMRFQLTSGFMHLLYKVSANVRFYHLLYKISANMRFYTPTL